MQYPDRPGGIGGPDQGASVPGTFDLRGGGRGGLVEMAPQARPARGQDAPPPSNEDQAQSDREALGDYETDSWRWNDPEAIRYDVEMARRKLREAQIIAGLFGASAGGRAAANLARARGGAAVAGALGGRVVGALLGPEVGAAVYVGGAASAYEVRQWERRLRALERRLAELGG